MPTLTSVAGDQFTNGGTSGPAAPSGGTLPTGSGIPLIGHAHRFATQFTGPQGPQGVLNQKLAAISTLAKTDPQAAQQQLLDAWATFLADSESFIGSQTGVARLQAQQVVGQALSTDALTQTVRALWGETGGQGDFNGLNQAVSSKSGNTGIGTTLINLLPGLIALAGLTIKATGSVGTLPGGQLPPSTTPAPTEPPTAPGQPPMSPGKAPTGIDQSWWDKYGTLVLTAGGTAANLWGAWLASNAATQAAQINQTGLANSTELSRQAALQARQDQFPWLERGTAALYRISDLVGIQPGQRMTPQVTPSYMSQPVPGSTFTQPSATPGTDVKPPGLDLQAIAAMYQRKNTGPLQQVSQ